MGKVYGIDLGTTYSVIATLNDNGIPEVIENYADSDKTLASAVYFPEGGDPVVGKAAKNQAEVEPERVVQYVKREIGKADATVRTFDGVDYDPITISALILKRMKEYAAEQGHEVKDVVITCPAYFGIPERNATKQAGIIAGLNVLKVVNEPTAAALNYCCREFQENRKIMVYDLGGGTFDITLFDFSVNESNEATINVLATGGNDRLGGIDWDKRLFDHMCEQYAYENAVEPGDMDGELRQKLRNQVEDAKKALSNMPSKSFTINHAGDSTRIVVTREKFEELTRDLVEQTLDFVHQTLQRVSLAPDDVDTVLLVGGSTKMPMVKDAVDKLFPGKVRREDPDLSVAKGAALAAALTWNEIHANDEDEDQAGGQQSAGTAAPAEGEKGAKSNNHIHVGGTVANMGESTLNDILSRSFGPAVINSAGEYVIDNLLFVNDPSPARQSRVYGTVRDDQGRVEIHIFENVATDRENTYVTPCLNERDEEQYTDPALKVKHIGVVAFDLPAGTPKDSPIEVIFEFSTSGLVVTAINQTTGESFPTEIISNTGATKSREQMEEDTKRLATIRTTSDF